MVDETPVKLHRIPKIAKFKRLWINRIKNVRKNFKPSNSTRVCSVHFEGGNGPKPWCKIPTIFPLKPAPKSPTPKRSLPRRVTKNSENLFGVCFHDYTPLLSPVDSMKTTEEDKTRCSRGTQTEIEKKDFGVQVCIPSVTAEDLKGNDEKTRFYTGFVNFATFMVIFKSLEQFTEKLNYWKGKDSLKEKNYLVDEVTQKPGPQRKMRLLDEFLMVLMRLRLGLLEQDLAQRFCVSSSTVSRILITWYNVLAEHFKHFIVWPTKETIQDHMPESFKRFPNTRVILDCTEFFIETPSSFVNQSVTYSSYKSHNTFKLLVGSSPTGAVTFLSKLWGGNASDKHIVKESGLLNLLEKGDSVMADKGFNMKDLLEPLVVTLNMPPMRDSNRQLSTKEVEQTRRIASVRIHVERKMEQIKNFRILRGTIPDTEWHNANNIVLICAALTNLEPPLVK
jgi:hypothetical protein